MMAPPFARVVAWFAGAVACCAWGCLGNGAVQAQPLLGPPGWTPFGPTAALGDPLSAQSPPVSQASFVENGSANRAMPEGVATLQVPTDEVLPIPADADDLPLDAQGPALSGDLFSEGAAEQSGWYVPAYWFSPFPWETSIEFGLNGSTGSNESLSINTGGHVLRETSFSKLDLDITYNRTTSSGRATQNNAQLDLRHDWLMNDDSPWTVYDTTDLFYDEFQAFDLQTSINAGVGYRFVRVDGLKLIGRFGGGASREFGGPVDRWIPESLLGFEYMQHLSKTQKVYGKLDYYPQWEELGEYRLVADAGWEVAFAQPSNVSLKLSATDRFDSTPDGADPHLVNYSLLLLLKL